MWKNEFLSHALSSIRNHPCMNNLLVRTVAIILHAIVNLLLVNWLVNFDITGKWIFFAGFILLLLFLLFLFVKHIVSFIYFIKTKTK